jgi:translation elongation factor EF-1alpha
MHKYGEKPLRACVLYKMHVGGVGVVLFVRVLTGLLRTGMSLSLCLAGSSHEVSFRPQCSFTADTSATVTVQSCWIRRDLLEISKDFPAPDLLASGH